MGKKKGAKDKSKGTTKKSKSATHAESKDIPPIVTIQIGNGKFQMENGDRYEGDYCAHRIGIVWREGYGVYRTHDGQIYRGVWKDDVLVNNSEAVIKFPNKQQFRGRVVKNKANGPGVFVLENSMEICCEFVDNKPVGHIILIDLFGNLWEGQAEKDGVLLFPENIFYKALTPDCGKGELIVKKKLQREKRPPLPSCKPDENILLMPNIGGYLFTKANTEKFNRAEAEYFITNEMDEQIAKPPKQLQSEFMDYERVFGVRRKFKPIVTRTESNIGDKQESKGLLPKAKEVEEADIRSVKDTKEELFMKIPECAIDVKEMEEIVFAKSGKTTHEGVFSYEAKYVQDYLKFRNRKAEIYTKIEENGEENLSVEDKQWLRKYQRFVRTMKSIHSRRKHKFDLAFSAEENEKAMAMLKDFFSKEWRNKWPVIPVFKPTPSNEN